METHAYLRLFGHQCLAVKRDQSAVGLDYLSGYLNSLPSALLASS